jgi:hypothetical protein
MYGFLVWSLVNRRRTSDRRISSGEITLKEERSTRRKSTRRKAASESPQMGPLVLRVVVAGVGQIHPGTNLSVPGVAAALLIRLFSMTANRVLEGAWGRLDIRDHYARVQR